MSQERVKEILTKYRTVAIVGLSRDPSQDSHRVAEYLKDHGFRIVPVNPFAEEVLGEKSYKNLSEMPPEVQRTLEIINIFRPPADVPPIVEQAVQLRKLYSVPRVVWMQLGIVNDQAAETAKEAGLTVIMDRCIMREHRNIFGQVREEK